MQRTKPSNRRSRAAEWLNVPEEQVSDRVALAITEGLDDPDEHIPEWVTADWPNLSDNDKRQIAAFAGLLREVGNARRATLPSE